jgi:cell division protein FtsZ
MKGARGLLISITGGNDLTLYELDEAATRIREEVDQDANIILGATFDESLEGIIRVSVVATGIDHELVANRPDLTSTEQRISEVAERLRAEARARAAHVQSVQTFRSAHASEPVRTAQPEPRPVQAPAPAPVEMPRAEVPTFQPMVRDDVVLTPTQPKQAVAYEPPPAPQPVSREEPLAAGSFIPPQAERVVRPARMPRVDELPMPAQNQIRARAVEAEPHPDQKRMTLLQRLATVGFGRKDEPAAPAPVEPPVQATRPVAEAPRQAASSVHAEYAKRPPAPQAYRPAQGGLDPHGRMPHQPRHVEDDQLEIPAFLRRQAN